MRHLIIGGTGGVAPRAGPRKLIKAVIAPQQTTQKVDPEPFKTNIAPTPFKGLNIPKPLNTNSIFKPLYNSIQTVKKPRAELRARTAADENSTPYVDRKLGESYFNAQTFPVKAGDVSPLGIVKDLGNVVVGSLGIPGEAARRFSLTATGEDPSKLPQTTSVVEDILPKGTGEQLGRFERFAHLPNGLARTAIEIAGDPVTWVGGGGIKAGAKAAEELGSIMARNAKVLNNINKGKTAVEKVATVANDTLKPILKNTLLPDPQSKIILNTKTPKKSFGEAISNFYTRVVDTSNPGKRVGEEFYTKATNSKSVGGIVDNNLTASLVDVKGNKVGDSLKQVAEQIPKGKEEDFWTYMSQRHNIDRAREGKNVQANYTPEMSTEATRRYEVSNPEYKQIGNNITKWIDDFMQTWGVDTGIVNRDIYTDLRKTYKNYFPTQRDFSTLENAIPNGTSRKFVDLNSPIRKATGSERNIINPLENIMNLVNRTVRTAKYNEVGKSLLDSVRKAPDKLSSLAEEIPTKDGMFSKLDNVVTVLENGKPTYLQINDKPLLDMLNGLPKTTISVPVLNKVTSGFKRLITQDNPIFAVRNIARDIPTYLVNGPEKNPLKALGNLGGAVKDIVTNSEKFQRYKGVGGGGANFFNSGNVSKSAAELTGRGNLLKKNIGAPIRGIEKFNNLTETAPRLAVFNKVYKDTGSVDKALFAANDVTVNFSRGGDITKAVDRNGIPYLNAGIQGLDKNLRQFKYKPIPTILKGATTITAPQLIIDRWNKYNPFYQQLDSRTKDNYVLIPNGLGEKDSQGNAKTFIKIPKSRELGVLFSSLIQRATSLAEGKPEAFKGFGSTVATNFAPTNPAENNLLSPITLNLKSNKDFAGRAIVPLGMTMDKRSPKLQYDEATSEIAKKMGELTNLSPKQIDYVIRSYTGVIGQLGLPATVKQNYQGGNTFQKLLKPLTTQFTADPLYSNNVLNDFYTNMDKLSQKATDRNITEKLPSKLVTSEEAIKSKFTKASTQISDINKLIKKETDVNKVRELKQKILDIAKGTNLMLK